jgi:class 3 adenylate cyclase
VFADWPAAFLNPGLGLMEQDERSVLIKLLMDLTQKVARGEHQYVDELLELTKEGKYPAVICELAESFGLMWVQVEAREMHLEKVIDELARKNRELEVTLARVRLLENVKDQLAKFVPHSVIDLIENNPDHPELEKREEDVTVLFLDIAGYTRLSERIAWEKVNYLIQTYFSSFLDVILGNEGDINETTGDGLMIIFRSPDRRAHAANAVRAALGIRAKTAQINEALRGSYESVTVNMGINSGTASVGSTRFEGVAGTRWTYTASGPVTNLAARISALAVEGAILAGAETFNRIGDLFHLDSVGRHSLKNVRKPVQVYQVV